ncbi:unnamed protein product [Gongylonema pulchrum]|uniref:Uncharacterized protein n=1 Tax=Gongylonema pulchrum TaxID=637853 RepID=A0A3P6RH07_9BILA|nr:unnamed protein product [Gongylonema pulchrum]
MCAMSKESRIFGPERASRGDAAGDKQHQPLDSLWDENADKYKFCCRALHITRATLYLAYAQMVLTFVFWLFFMFYYVQTKLVYISVSLLFGTALQLLFVLLLVYGLRTERRSFLLPFILSVSSSILFEFAEPVLLEFGRNCGSAVVRCCCLAMLWILGRQKGAF